MCALLENQLRFRMCDYKLPCFAIMKTWKQSISLLRLVTNRPRGDRIEIGYISPPLTLLYLYTIEPCRSKDRSQPVYVVVLLRTFKITLQEGHATNKLPFPIL
jgi:hypothetical protein